jgi:iron complex transport system substrate-binding protein
MTERRSMRFFSRVFAAVIALAVCSVAAMYAPARAPAGTGVDSRGEKVTIPSTGARVVSLSPGATETLYELGVRSEIVGVSDFCDYPPAFVGTKARMGGVSTPNIERIQEAKPHAVILTTMVPLSVKAQFDRLGIALFVTEPKSFSQLLRLVEQLGLLLNKKNEARALAVRMSEEAGRVTAAIRFKSVAPVRTFIEVWYSPYYAAERGTLPGDIVTLAGGRVVPDTGNQYSQIGEEALLELDPEAIILGHRADLQTFLDTHRNLAGVFAVRNRKILSTDPDEFLRPGPRVLKSLAEIAHFLHPEAL